MSRIIGGADLHLHTIYSDGSYSPERLVERALAVGLTAIAVTDHDTADGVEPVRKAAAGRIEVIAGVEFSVEVDDGELHILGLFLQPDNDILKRQFAEFRDRRTQRVREITGKLRNIGIDVSPEDIFQKAGAGVPGRVHIAQVLVDKNYVKTTGAAFARLLGRGAPAFVNKVRPNPAETLELIHSAGGVSVFAHPGLTKRDHLIPGLVKDRLQGIEAITPAHSPGDTERYLKIAEEYGLLVSAGSDCHGDNKNRELIGLVRLSDERLEGLRAAAARAGVKRI